MPSALLLYVLLRKLITLLSGALVTGSTSKLLIEFEFIDKQPMKAGQGLKSSLATQKHRKKNDTHTHK